MKIYLLALGCKLNQSEIDALARRFLAAGHEIVLDAEEAEVCILNTCTVTHIASRKSRQALRRLRRANRSAFLVATGCYAEISPQEIKALGGVDMIAGNDDKERIPALLASRIPHLASAAPMGPANSAQKAGPLSSATPRTRAFVKIQDGCDNACTYCIVAKARGAAVSRPYPEVLGEIRERLSEGYKEVVLTGVHIGAYGRERGESLAGLVQKILAETAVPRLRLSSIEPWDFSHDLLAFWRDSRLCRHLHLPLQSGCDATLQRMGRRYTAQQYAEIVRQARAIVADIAITTDVIVGFPGESEGEFAASLEFVKQQGFARLHVFPYSLRQGTPAAMMPHQMRPEEKEARSKIMQQAGREGTRRSQEQYLGRIFAVLWENQVEAQGPSGLPVWRGLTDNYIPVFVESSRILANVIAPARLVALRPAGVWAEVQEAASFAADGQIMVYYQAMVHCEGERDHHSEQEEM